MGPWANHKDSSFSNKISLLLLEARSTISPRVDIVKMLLHWTSLNEGNTYRLCIYHRKQRIFFLHNGSWLSEFLHYKLEKYVFLSTKWKCTNLWGREESLSSEEHHWTGMVKDTGYCVEENRKNELVHGTWYVNDHYCNMPRKLKMVCNLSQNQKLESWNSLKLEVTTKLKSLGTSVFEDLSLPHLSPIEASCFHLARNNLILQSLCDCLLGPLLC